MEERDGFFWEALRQVGSMQEDLSSFQNLEEPCFFFRRHLPSRRQVLLPCLDRVYVGLPSRLVDASCCPLPFLGVRMLSTYQPVEEPGFSVLVCLRVKNWWRVDW